jgi:SAM-dependent methyltransferase
MSLRTKTKRLSGHALTLVRRVERHALSGRGVLSNRYLAGKLLPLDANKPYALLTRPLHSELAADGFPLPPPELWQRWAPSAESYLEGGRLNADAMFEMLRKTGASVPSIRRILDFGCAEGRMLRHLPSDPERELWGVDINAERIAWCEQHLAPPFRFATTTTMPHLPFGEDHFDLIYAISVFTHIGELGDAWFLELLRILRPGGHIFLTVHDEHSVAVLLDRHRPAGEHTELVNLLLQFDHATHALSRDWVYFAVHADPGAQVFYKRDDLVRKWSQFAEPRGTRPEAIGYQTALVFRKSLTN